MQETISGRVTSFRSLGKISFGKIVTSNERLQFVLKKGVTNDDIFSRHKKNTNIGDIITVGGYYDVTQTGERSLLLQKHMNYIESLCIHFPTSGRG